MSRLSTPTVHSRMSSRRPIKALGRALADVTADDYLEGDDTSHSRIDGPLTDPDAYLTSFDGAPILTHREREWVASRAGLIVSRGKRGGETVHWYASAASLEAAWDTLLDLQGKGQL